MGNLQTPKPKFHCDNKTIPVNENLTLLVVTIDNKLKYSINRSPMWQEKVSQQLAVLKRLRNILPLEIRKNIYQAFIDPHFDYCSDVWQICSKTASNKLEKVNERALHFVLKDKEVLPPNYLRN